MTRVAPIGAQHVKQCGVHGALCQPELIGGDPRAVVQLPFVDGAAGGTPVLLWRPGIEVQHGALDLAAASRSREQRLGFGNVRRASQQRLQLGGERFVERRERAVNRATAVLELGVFEEEHINGARRRLWVLVRPCSSARR